MTQELFLQPHLIGERFEGHSIPLEFLRDFAVLEELIVEVAKWKFLQDNPGRQRSPRNFTQGIELKLTGIEDGSAKPIISLIIAASMLFPPHNHGYFIQARDAIIAAISAAQHNTVITEHLSEKSLGYFDRIGRGLRDGESMEFTVPGTVTPARLTKETRRRLVLASTRGREYTEGVSVWGSIPEADQDDLSFEIQLFDGRKVIAPMDSQHKDKVFEAFNEYMQGAKVFLQGVGKFTVDGRLLSIESVERVDILDALDVPARLNELSYLQDGWLEGKGIAPSQEGLDWLGSTFDQNFPDSLPLPHVYPTADGNVQVEWSVEPFEATLEINIENHSAEWHCLNMTTDFEETHILSLDEVGDWEWLIEKIRSLTGGEA